MALAPGLSLAYLQAEVSRLAARLQREVHRWQPAGHDPRVTFRSLKMNGEEDLKPLACPLAPSGASPRRWHRPRPPASPPALRLAEALGYNPVACGAFHVYLALNLDQRTERPWGYPQDATTRQGKVLARG